MGPVQVLVVGFDEPSFSGAALEELERLRDAGIVRLIDLLVVTRGEDGELTTLEPPASVAPGAGEVAAAVLGGGAAGTDAGAEPDGATWSLADAVPPGATAAVALIEHLWAAPLLQAIGGAGGRMLEETWLAAGDVEALEALLARRTGA
jgi:uncharacterized membrane protein